MRNGGTIEAQSELITEYGNEFISLHHSEKTEHVEDTLESHVKESVGLYLLFKDYITLLQEGKKT
jgi:predicted GTPase